MGDKKDQGGIDAAEVLKGNEAEVSAVLGKASAADLKALHDAENGEDGQKRKGVTSQIEGEQKARTELAEEAIASAIEAANAAGAQLFVFRSEDEFEKPGEHERLRAEVRELETAIAKRDEDAANKAPKPKKPKARQLKVDDKAIPLIAALAFTDAEGHTLKDFPDLDTRPTNLKPERGGMAYMAEVLFDETTGRKQDLHRVFALDANGKAIAECKLVAPLTVGGGTTAFLPRGTIYFADWPKSKAEA